MNEIYSGGGLAVSSTSLNVSRQERNWGLAAHLSALSGYLGLSAGNVIGPLIVWLARKDESPFVSEHAKEALNFQISLLIYLAISVPLALFLIGFALLFVIPIFGLIFTIVAAVKASDGSVYRYPLTIRFFR